MERMVPDMTMQEMVTAYNKFSAAHKYALGFIEYERLYYTMTDFDKLSTYFKLDRMSSKRGGTAKIRIRMTAAQRRELVASGEAIELGPKEMLDFDDCYNRGDHFERVMLETLTDKVWHKNSDTFNVAGDLQYNGEEIQVKFDSAELTNEKFLSKLLATA